MKKILYIIAICSTLLLAGCEAIDAVIPDFTTKLQNVFSGVYAYPEANPFISAYYFNGTEKTFKHYSYSSDTPDYSGTFSYEYTEYNITKVKGNLTLTKIDPDTNEVIEILKYLFVFEANVEDGPLYLSLTDSSNNTIKYKYNGASK